VTGNPRLLVLMTFATALVVGGVIALATGKWWALLIPVALHVVASFVVLSGVFKAVEQGDKPDPVTEARLEDERAHSAR
jgi:membrane protein implicated in regulation of membrane protease activity